MADETTDIEQQDSQELTPQQQGIQFEDILPWGTPGGDTGLSSRLKLKRNFEKIKAWIDSLDLSALMGDKFLSKKEDDTAEGLITFLKGLLVGNGTHGIDADGAAQLLSLVFDSVLMGKDALRGFEGGRGIYMDAKEGLIQTDGLEVRGFQRIMELIINRLQLMESDYSFTEGASVEHVYYTDDGRLRLVIHKNHDRDYVPFYEGDILYAKINALLPRGSAVPDGFTVTKNGAYYTVWMVVDEVDYTSNTITVSLYPSKEVDGDPIVPGGLNFTIYGTPIQGSDLPSVALATEYAITAAAASGPAVLAVSGRTLGEDGFDTNVTLTRHGNTATAADATVRKNQLARQQSWVLSTTDQRLSYFWRVDEPIIRDHNYALCLGMLPDLANLPSTRDRSMPSLYINTIFWENEHHIYYPSRIIKEDRGDWVPAPQIEYTGPAGTYTPDGTLTEEQQAALGGGVTVAAGGMIDEPYHYQGVPRNTWLTHRLSPTSSLLSDAGLLQKILTEWHLDLETSRVWHYGTLWECRVEGSAVTPWVNTAHWQCIRLASIVLSIAVSRRLLRERYFLDGAVGTTMAFVLKIGEYDVTSLVHRDCVEWTRQSVGADTDAALAAADAAWASNVGYHALQIQVRSSDLPSNF